MIWIERHRKSEQLAAAAEIAKHNGEIDKALALYKAAAEVEDSALALITQDKTRTIGVAAVSAASLYFKANEYELSEKLALSYLIKLGIPQFAKDQLKNIVQTIWNERVFKKSGVQFIRGELLISVAGGLVAVGAAPLDLVHRKVEEIKNLYYRAVEMLLGLSLRKHGVPEPIVRDNFRPWILQAPAGSYQFALRVEKPSQMDLFPSATPEIEEVTRTLLRIIEASSIGAIEQLDDIISSEEYKDCFIKQVRNLAPTGKTFNQLTIRSTSHEEFSPVVFSPQTRKVLTDTIRAREKQITSNDHLEQKQIIGILRGLQLDKDWLDITEENTGQHIKVYQAGDMIDDLIGPMVNHKVLVDVYIDEDGKRIYKDIQPEE